MTADVTTTASTPECLSNDELARIEDLSPVRIAHLDGCLVCQKSVEELFVADPRQLAVPVFRRAFGASKWVAPLGATLLLCIGVLAFGAVAAGSRIRSLERMVSVESSRARDAESRLAELSRLVQPGLLLSQRSPRFLSMDLVSISNRDPIVACAQLLGGTSRPGMYYPSPYDQAAAARFEIENFSATAWAPNRTVLFAVDPTPPK